MVYDKPRKGDIRSNYGDLSKAEKTLGFEAKTSLREGIEKMASGFCGKDGVLLNFYFCLFIFWFFVEEMDFCSRQLP